MNWIFHKDKMTDRIRDILPKGIITYGITDKRTDTVFIQVSIHKTFTELYKTMIHETLHTMIDNMQEEYIIRKLA